MAISQKLIAIALTFVGRQVFLRVLSVEYLGLNGLIIEILGLLSLADMGLATAMAYSFYKPLAEQDEKKLSALTGFYKKIYNIIALAVATIGLLILPFFRQIINIESEIPYIELYFLVMLANTVVSYLFVYKTSLVTADQNRSIVLKYRIWCSILNSLLQIIILLTTGSFLLFCITNLVTTLTANFLISRKAEKMYPFLKQKVKIDEADKRAVFQNVKSMLVYKTSMLIINGTDIIFISILAGTAMVGKYTNYMLAVTNLNQLSFMGFAALSASLGNLVAKEAPEKRLKIFKILQTASYWTSSFFLFCLFFLLDDFVMLWLGEEFVFDLMTKIMILLVFYMTISLYPVVAFREATGMYQKTKYLMVISAIIKIVFTITFGLHFGLPGIIFATLLAKLLTYVWYEPKILFRDYLGGSAFKYLVGNVLNFMMLTVFISVTHFLLPWGESTGWMDWVFKGIVYAAVINAICLLRFYRTPEFKIILNKLGAMMKKEKNISA